MRLFLFKFCQLLSLVLLSSCTGYMTTPVGEEENIEESPRSVVKSQKPKPVNSPKTHIVVSGDTLFSIAMRYDLDYKELASSNNIPPPYVIKPNDKINIDDISNEKVVDKSNDVAVNRLKKPVGSTQGNKTGVVETKGVKVNQGSTLQVVKSSKAVSNQKIPILTESNWIWPVQGKLIRLFSPQDALSKGIDISAEIGTPIKSARGGLVVYAGSGLKGYGNLIIIRHDETYISAYAHNRVNFVKEGDKVSQGDRIAELGMSGTQEAKLHFEIRKQGKPINPLGLLPKT